MGSGRDAPRSDLFPYTFTGVPDIGGWDRAGHTPRLESRAHERE